MAELSVPAEHYDLTDLLRLMERLRDPEYGCPWDLAQDVDTIVPSTPRGSLRVGGSH